MRAVIQRVQKASVTVNHRIISVIDQGLLVFLGIESNDNQEDINWLSHKIAGLRIFDDENGILNRSVREVNGHILVVSQFTLHARIKKGFRPSFVDAAPSPVSIPLYEAFIRQLELELGHKVLTGEFGVEMKVSLVNDGPVTIWIDTKNKH
ncbi:MAG: D-tyrosyl-tRNA(Tyr) deacylase [Bacteroidales bacterium]|nr:D-tyrosyl-tRNA(Tyr) deacylase [Bacteroidales bacterium]